MSNPLRLIWILSKSLNLIGCHGNLKGKFLKKCSKINSSEAVWGIKLKHCRIISNNNLFKNVVFYCCCWSTLVAMATQSFHWLTMGKRKLRFFAISLQIFWQKFYRNVPGVVLYKQWFFVLLIRYRCNGQFSPPPQSFPGEGSGRPISSPGEKNNQSVFSPPGQFFPHLKFFNISYI